MILEDTVLNIKKAAFIGGTDVVHYSSMKTLKALMKKHGRFRLYRAADMNDTTEGNFFFDLIGKVWEDYKEQKVAQAVAWIGSFILYQDKDRLYSDDDILLFWRLYGKDKQKEAMGCSLKYSNSLFAKKNAL